MTTALADGMACRSPDADGLGLILRWTPLSWFGGALVAEIIFSYPGLGSTILTAFNDNAAITYLSTLVPGFTDSMKYAVVSGAVAGGGLTIIANAPNPAGQAILKKFFANGLSPLGLFKSAVLPTLIVWFCFFILS